MNLTRYHKRIKNCPALGNLSLKYRGQMKEGKKSMGRFGYLPEFMQQSSRPQFTALQLQARAEPHASSVSQVQLLVAWLVTLHLHLRMSYSWNKGYSWDRNIRRERIKGGKAHFQVAWGPWDERKGSGDSNRQKC